MVLTIHVTDTSIVCIVLSTSSAELQTTINGRVVGRLHLSEHVGLHMSCEFDVSHALQL